MFMSDSPKVFGFNFSTISSKMDWTTIFAFVGGSTLTLLAYQIFNYAKRSTTPFKEPINTEEDAYDPIVKDYLPKNYNLKSVPITEDLPSSCLKNPITDQSKLYPITRIADILMKRDKTATTATTTAETNVDFAVGWGFDRSNVLHLHLNTNFSDCEPKYFDFWFKNMCNGKGKYHWYKWWHPVDHIKAWYSPNEIHPLNDKINGIYGHNKHVYEYLGKETGNPMDYLIIQFIDPSEIGFKKQDYNDIDNRFIIVIKIGFLQFQANTGYLVHFIEKWDESKHNGKKGCIMKSRWYIGCNAQPRDSVPFPLSFFISCLYKIPFVKKAILPPGIAQRVLIHGNREMNNLATFLPELYKLYHENLKNV